MVLIHPLNRRLDLQIRLLQLLLVLSLQSMQQQDTCQSVSESVVQRGSLLNESGLTLWSKQSGRWVEWALARLAAAPQAPA